MWIIFGVTAIIFTIINWIQFIKGKDNSLSAVIAISLTIYTYLLENLMYLKWIRLKDYSAIEDVLPSMIIIFTILITVSIVLNVTPVYIRHRRSIKVR